MVGFILRFRYLAVVVALIILVHSLGLVVVGLMRAVQAYQLLSQGPGWSGPERPGIHIAESVDVLLFALVLMVLSLGTATLFLADGKEPDRRIPVWMRVSSLSELKLLLWEAILVVLVMAAMTALVTHIEELHWELLVLPAAILMLSVSLYFARKGPHSR